MRLAKAHRNRSRRRDRRAAREVRVQTIVANASVTMKTLAGYIGTSFAVDHGIKQGVLSPAVGEAVKERCRIAMGREAAAFMDTVISLFPKSRTPNVGGPTPSVIL